MANETFTVLNVKCGGCAANIKNGLTEINSVDSVEVEIESGSVQVEGTQLDRSQLSEKLSQLGYPEA